MIIIQDIKEGFEWNVVGKVGLECQDTFKLCFNDGEPVDLIVKSFQQLLQIIDRP